MYIRDAMTSVELAEQMIPVEWCGQFSRLRVQDCSVVCVRVCWCSRGGPTYSSSICTSACSIDGNQLTNVDVVGRCLPSLESEYHPRQLLSSWTALGHCSDILLVLRFFSWQFSHTPTISLTSLHITLDRQATTSRVSIMSLLHAIHAACGSTLYAVNIACTFAVLH